MGLDAKSSGLRQNVELKARLVDFDRARRIARDLSAGPPQLLRQVDTYFRCVRGRLKLREIAGEQSELIAYARSDETAPRTSEFRIVPVLDAAALRAALEQSLGILVVVEKLREISLYRNVRIHLDQVNDLGTFVEFEAMLATPGEHADGERLVRELSSQFGLAPQDLVGCSYSDLLLAAAGLG
jgi:predicted adenylyl cyclase CyaB